MAKNVKTQKKFEKTDLHYHKVNNANFGGD